VRGVYTAKLFEDQLNQQELASFLNDLECGAETWFHGIVRNNNLGRAVIALEYDVQKPLAEKTLEMICDEALTQFGDGLQIVVAHRIGKLNVGETSVSIGVRAPHRNEAFLACRYLIEQLKVRVPIWKKEYYTDGESEWLRGCQHSHEDVVGQ